MLRQHALHECEQLLLAGALELVFEFEGDVEVIGEVDTQDPHTEDEIYVCVSGRARFVTPSTECEVGPGTIIFVPAREEHRFVDVIERLQLVVVFGPAEGSRA